MPFAWSSSRLEKKLMIFRPVFMIHILIYPGMSYMAFETG